MSRRPPPPGDDYIWVKPKNEPGYYRKKRGTIKEAVLNAAFQKSNDNTKLSSPAARRIVAKLHPWLNRLQTGRLTVKISGRLTKALNKTGTLDLSYLNGFDLQPNHPIQNLLLAPVTIDQQPQQLTIRIPIDSHTIKRFNKLVTNYYFELILLYGDAGRENGLRTESTDSEVFAIGENRKQPWVAFLKISCIEGNETAASSRLYGMKVMATTIHKV